MPDSVASHLEPQLQGDRLRLLIVGAGIAGATLGALLRQRGEAPAMIERQPQQEDGGYMLGLLPLGGRVLNGLGLAEAYEQNSIGMNTYQIYGRDGKLIHTYPLAPPDRTLRFVARD